MHRVRYHVSSILCRTFAAAALLAAVSTAALAAPCAVPDNGTGTITLPPANCPYLSPNDVHMIINGLPPGTTVEVGVEHFEFFQGTTHPGGSLGGEVENFQSMLRLDLQGTGGMAGYHRTVQMQAGCETHTAPRTPGITPQSFDTDMFRIQGQLPPGDPDFDLLRITAGTGFGMPSPGHTTLTRVGAGPNWAVDSFFDITYRIDFVGRAGGPFGGMSGSTTGTIRMKAGEPPPPPCMVVDNGTGTVNLPPDGCGYVSPADLHKMIDGLPAGTTINVAANHNRFFNVQRNPGGALGGEVEQFGSNLQIVLTADAPAGSSLEGYQRALTMSAQCQTHVGPRTPGAPVQDFDTMMNGLQGQLPPGDPDFDLLRITAGNAFGLPSPGHTTLTRIPGTPNWAVDSFFDITYRIDFVGRPGGPFGGMSGSTTGTIRMQSGQPGLTAAPDITGSRVNVELRNRPNPFGRGTTIEYRLATPSDVQLRIYDVAGKLVRNLVSERTPAGPHAIYWDARNDDGKKLAPGAYFLKLSVNGRLAATKRATIIK